MLMCTKTRYKVTLTATSISVRIAAYFHVTRVSHFRRHLSLYSQLLERENNIPMTHVRWNLHTLTAGDLQNVKCKLRTDVKLQTLLQTS